MDPILHQRPITMACLHISAKMDQKLNRERPLARNRTSNRMAIRIQNRTCRRPLTEFPNNSNYTWLEWHELTWMTWIDMNWHEFGWTTWNYINDMNWHKWHVFRATKMCRDWFHSPDLAMKAEGTVGHLLVGLKRTVPVLFVSVDHNFTKYTYVSSTN
jgi:hypothetical protein